MNPTLRFCRIACAIVPALSACAPTGNPESLSPLETLPTVQAKSLVQALRQNRYGENPDNVLNAFDPEVTSIDKAFEKAQIAQAEGQTDRALFYYVKALQFEPKNIQALEQIAAIHEQNNKPELALRIYRDILEIDANNVVSNETLGLNYLANRNPQQAKQHLNSALAQDGSRWKAHNGLGLIADMNKEYAVAIGHYQKALALNPSNPMLLNNLGYSHYLKDDDKTAKNYFNQALAFDGHYQRAVQNLALIEMKHKQYAAALAIFNRMMKPYESYNNMGYLCMLKGEYELAENYFRQAIEESPKYFPKAQENLNQLQVLRNLQGSIREVTYPE